MSGIKRFLRRLRNLFVVKIYTTERKYVLETEGKPLKGKNVVVTGGNGAIGKTICFVLAAKGAMVYVSGRNAERVQVVVNEINRLGLSAKPLIMDVRDSASIEQVFKREFSRQKLDFLVSCAGGSSRERASELTSQQIEVIDEILNVNLRGAMLSARTAAQYMIPKHNGKIIFISSVIGIQGKANFSEYAASKAGLFGFAKSLALELGEYGIQVNCVSPGFIQRGFYTDMQEERLKKTNCLHKVGTPTDIAEAVAFFLSDRADFITGQNLIVDGGRSLGLYGDG